jgi:hypothetical protein
MMQSYDGLPHVEATLSYIAPMTERPRTLAYEPPPGVPGTNIVSEPHMMPIHDVRPIVSDINLGREGFAVLHHLTAVRDFYDDDEVRRVYSRKPSNFCSRFWEPTVCWCSTIPFVAVSQAWRTGRQARRGNLSAGSMWTTQIVPAHNASGISWESRLRSCCADGPR